MNKDYSSRKGKPVRAIDAQMLYGTWYLLQELGTDLTDTDYILYSNVFTIIARYVNNKLSLVDICGAYDTLTDVIFGKRPDLAIVSPAESKIHAMIRLMESIPETRGKLTLEEKKATAFCIWTAAAVQTYDEEQDCMVSGLRDFDSFEHIEAEYQGAKKELPHLFETEPIITQPEKGYGKSIENPIHSTSVRDSYLFLNMLHYRGQKVLYDRIGSVSDENGRILDLYQLSMMSPYFSPPQERKLCRLYIDPYCIDNPPFAPAGFTLE